MLAGEPVMLDAKYLMVIKWWWCGRKEAEDGGFDLAGSSQGGTEVRGLLGSVWSLGLLYADF